MLPRPLAFAEEGAEGGGEVEGTAEDGEGAAEGGGDAEGMMEAADEMRLQRTGSSNTFFVPS